MQPTASSRAARRAGRRAPRRPSARGPRSASRRAARRGRERGHVGERARAVGDVGEHDDVAGARRRPVVGCGPSSASASNSRSSSPRARGEPLEHVAVGREVAAVGDERAAPRASSAAAHELVEVDRRRVARRSPRPGAAPSTPAPSTSPARAGASIHSGQPPTSSVAPLRRSAACSRSRVASGSRPSELPSR